MFSCATHTGTILGIPASEFLLSQSPEMNCGVAVLLSSCGTSLECGFWVFFTIWMFVVVCGETGDDAWRVMFTAVNACHVTEKRGVYNNHQQTIASSHSILQLSAASSSVTQAKGKLWLCLPGKCLMAYREEWPWVRQSRNMSPIPVLKTGWVEVIQSECLD